MSANSIEVQLELVRFLSQLQELFRASEPKKSLCSLRLGNYAYLSRLPFEIRKGLQLLSLAFKNYTFPWFLSEVQGEPWNCSRLCKVRLHLSIHKQECFKGSFQPTDTFCLFSFTGNSESEGQSTKQRENWPNEKVWGIFLLGDRSMLWKCRPLRFRMHQISCLGSPELSQ